MEPAHLSARLELRHPNFTRRGRTNERTETDGGWRRGRQQRAHHLRRLEFAKFPRDPDRGQRVAIFKLTLIRTALFAAYRKIDGKVSHRRVPHIRLFREYLIVTRARDGYPGSRTKVVLLFRRKQHRKVDLL